jgi:membrane protease YdiL (CAAX protease family)
VKALIARRPVAAFFVLAYAFSWAVEIPLALQARGTLPMWLPWWAHYFALCGPAIAAVVVARVLGKPLVKARPLQRSRQAAWWVIGGGVPLALLGLLQVAGPLADWKVPSWSDLGRVNFLPDLGWAAALLWFVTSCGEEIGWRGFALPRLQQRQSALSSTLRLTIGWACWHLPAFFYLPSYAAIGLIGIPGFFVGIGAGAIVLTWLYNSSGGRMLPAVLWHASFNWVTAAPRSSGVTAAVISTVVMVWAAAILWRTDVKTLSSDVTRRTRVSAAAPCS